MLVRFQPVTTIFDEIDSLINGRLIPYPTVNRTNRFPGITLKDTGEELNVVVQLSGVTKEDVKVNLNNNVLTISAERKQPELQKNEQVLRNEIRYGKFERSIELPYSVDAEKVSATHENGILSIVLAKHENAKPKQIVIK